MARQALEEAQDVVEAIRKIDPANGLELLVGVGTAQLIDTDDSLFDPLELKNEMTRAAAIPSSPDLAIHDFIGQTIDKANNDSLYCIDLLTNR